MTERSFRFRLFRLRRLGFASKCHASPLLSSRRLRAWLASHFCFRSRLRLSSAFRRSGVELGQSLITSTVPSA
jgi:hypothetical protein